MEWYIIVLLFLLLLLFIGLIIALVCMLSGQTCSISIQQRTTNAQLTQLQREQEEKHRNKFTNRLKHAFNSTDKSEQPLVAPVEDVKTVELKFKLGNDQEKSQDVVFVHEPTNLVSAESTISEVESKARQKRREARQKLHEDMKRKYSH